MIKSMTGYGRGEANNEFGSISVEIKAVNHRYLDLGVKLPRKFNFLEATIRNKLKEKIIRGKVDVYISYEQAQENGFALNYNENLAKSYLDCFTKMQERFAISADVNAVTLSRMPEVLSLEQKELDDEKIWECLAVALDDAIEHFISARFLEGSQLEKDLVTKLDHVYELVLQVEEWYPNVLENYRNRLEAKVHELLDNTTIDENRIATEIVLYADKICVDEEIVRIKSHIVQMKECLQSHESIGRKLDFITQEFNREANTMLSKTNDPKLADIAIEIKTEIEKVREQIQNVE